MEFELGKDYSGYRFLDVVRRSKDGIEYRVQNILAQRQERLRVLPEAAQGDLEQTERFLREVHVRSRLIHPNIVTLFNGFELQRQLVMTTELLEGPALFERLELGVIPWREAATLIRQALSAIGFAHEQNVIHRDINPENIVITPGGILKLNNFGLAKTVDGPKLTQVGTILGNVYYISPEQVKGTAALDSRTDLYSLGAVFYHMLCGRPPFNSTSQFEVMLAHVNTPPWSPSVVNPTLPRELDAVVLTALAKDPAKRYQDAAAFAAALDAALSAIDAPTTADAPAAAHGAGPPHLPMPPVLAPAFPSAESKPAASSFDWLFYGGLAAGASAILWGMWLVAQ